VTDIADAIIAAIEGPRGPEIAALIVKRATETPRPVEEPVDLGGLLRSVASSMGVTTDEMRSERRTRKITDARAVFAHLARMGTSASYAVIGRGLGGQDHSTIVTSARRGSRLVLTNDLADAAVRNTGPPWWVG